MRKKLIEKSPKLPKVTKKSTKVNNKLKFASRMKNNEQAANVSPFELSLDDNSSSQPATTSKMASAPPITSKKSTITIIKGVQQSKTTPPSTESSKTIPSSTENPQETPPSTENSKKTPPSTQNSKKTPPIIESTPPTNESSTLTKTNFELDSNFDLNAQQMMRMLIDLSSTVETLKSDIVDIKKKLALVESNNKISEPLIYKGIDYNSPKYSSTSVNKFVK
jgi:hypothetical protein